MGRISKQSLQVKIFTIKDQFYSELETVVNVRKIIILLLLFLFTGAKAQGNRYLSLFTDRELYISGENILFKIFAPENEQSRIVRVKLINTNRKILSEVIKKMSNHQADGFIQIPDSIKTGTYLICTSSDENNILTIRELFICNRFTGLTGITSWQRLKDTISTNNLVTDLKIEGLNNIYKPRGKAKVSLHLPGQTLSEINGNLSLTVVKIVSGYRSSTTITTTQPQNKNFIGIGSIAFSGYAKDLITELPFNKACIFLSVPDSIPRLQYFITGPDGRFDFKLDNYYGKVPAVVQGFDMEKRRLLKIVTDHHDSLQIDKISFETKAIPSDLQKIFDSDIEATTLSKVFRKEELLTAGLPLKQQKYYPFYGVPTEVVYPNIFVDLPDFTEISRELLPGVKFRAFNRIPTLQILNPSTLNYYNNQPLVLLDGIPVQDLNTIKNLGSKDISRIEICRNERFFGDLSFQGVVAIFSSKKDLKKLAESDDLKKFSLEGIQPDVSLYIPEGQPLYDPDLRKVLVWKPSVEPTETINIDFETSDLKGTYQLSIRGKTRNGSIIYKTQIFEVN